MTRDQDDVQALRRALGRGPRPGAAADEAPEDVWKAAQGQLSAGDLDAWLERARQDPDLAADWQLATALTDELESASSGPQAPTPGVWRQPSVWVPLLGVAALLLVGVVVERPHWRPWDQPSTVLRDVGIAPVAAEPADAVTLGRDEILLRWDMPEGARAAVRVYGADLRTLHSAFELTTGEARVPAHALADLSDGALVLWQVTLRLPDGSTRTTPVRAITLR
jgi:hypothetical protein